MKYISAVQAGQRPVFMAAEDRNVQAGYALNPRLEQRLAFMAAEDRNDMAAEDTRLPLRPLIRQVLPPRHPAEPGHEPPPTPPLNQPSRRRCERRPRTA